MKKLLIIIILILLPLPLLAQGKNTITLGSESVVYTEIFEEGGTSYYYNEDVLVMSKHNDGVWLLYKDNTIILEAHDTDLDGKLDIFFKLNNKEEVIKTNGEGLVEFSSPEIIYFQDIISGDGTAQGNDLVGDLDSIKIPSGTSKTLIFVITIIFAITGYMIWSRKQR